MFPSWSSIVNNSTTRTDTTMSIATILKRRILKKKKEKEKKERGGRVKKRSGVELSNPEREESNRFNGPDPSLARQACK